MLLHGYLVHLPQHSVQANRKRKRNVTLLRILQNCKLKELSINFVTTDQSANATHWYCQTRTTAYYKTGNLLEQSYFGQRQLSGQCNSHKLKGNSSLTPSHVPRVLFPFTSGQERNSDHIWLAVETPDIIQVGFCKRNCFAFPKDLHP